MSCKGASSAPGPVVMRGMHDVLTLLLTYCVLPNPGVLSPSDWPALGWSASDWVASLSRAQVRVQPAQPPP